MSRYTPYQARYFAEQVMLKRTGGSEGIVQALTSAKVDLNPHQVDAATFALQSPLLNGVLLADEVGLGKTIEAGILIAQCWAEYKRKIILVVPASLRTQWMSELEEKFFIKSIILEGKNFNQMKKKGMLNPFEQTNRVIICSYNFASQKQLEVSKVAWNLVVMDEAHRLRNVYKPSNIMGNRLKKAFAGTKKLLLTATPLQNNLMELYGLVSIIDDRVFSDPKTFRENYIKVSNEETRDIFLKARIRQFCKRTLRKQVVEYVPFTKRRAILKEFEPAPDEELLYNGVSEYLRAPILYALPNSQRKLMTLILRKLLASSSFAIAGTMDSLIDRLENLLKGIEKKLDMSDYDSFEEFLDENQESLDEDQVDVITRHKEIEAELKKLKGFAVLAKSIKSNAKGQNLLTALEMGFAETVKHGGQRKAVIFTESKRTQTYLYNLLSDNGYAGQIVFLNGSNSDADSKEIYKAWQERHKNDDYVSGSRQADMKSAIVEEFRSRASILIGTEAAAEGINLQFCSLLVNYDLPWNPQRIEQRIGRCHRYGQKNDVVVVNFLNVKNEADKRVYELLDKKFKLFNGLFGASDEVLGSIESGVDFEKRIAEIYQNCKTKEEIQIAFDEIQEEYKDRISSKMKKARQSILENFDDEVAKRLKFCKENTIESVSRYAQWLYYFMLAEGGNKIDALDGTRLYYHAGSKYDGYYNLDWKDSESRNEQFLRRDNILCQNFIERCQKRNLPIGNIAFDYEYSGHNISYFDVTKSRSGWIKIEKLTNDGYESDEHLLVTALDDTGKIIAKELVNRLMELPSKALVLPKNVVVPKKLEKLAQEHRKIKIKEIEEQNKKYFLEECEKLDNWSEDKKRSLEDEIKTYDKIIKDKKREMQLKQDESSLTELLAKKAEIQKWTRARDKKRRDLFVEQDRVDQENERLQAEVSKRLKGKNKIGTIFTIRYQIV